MGGGAMRTAAKVAGLTAGSSGFRGFTGEHSMVRRAASVLPPSVSIADDVRLVASPPQQAAVQKSWSEMEDRVWAEAGEEEAMVSAADPLPRVVFGGAPTLQEAKEATSELTVALQTTYLSSPDSAARGGSFPADHETGSSISNSQVMENKACDTVAAPSVPAHAIKAFRFLHESSAAQTAVASIASDPKVWNAVLQNTELQEFLRSQQPCVSPMTMKFDVDSDSLDQASENSTNSSSDFPDSEPSKGFMDYILMIKTTVVDMMNSLSDYFQDFESQGPRGIFVNSDGTLKVSADTVMEASFMGLAIMAILVILLKRA